MTVRRNDDGIHRLAMQIKIASQHLGEGAKEKAPRKAGLSRWAQTGREVLPNASRSDQRINIDSQGDAMKPMIATAASHP
ncbi:hypothetical protein Bcep1808_2155 [Burkholderia vietnamiensis G4]|uniref:Uncharacterized protein n=1 Tax=Burkholderia vietnamiensis (strain G4 / LMG 22486) TaxID=269482 RepID=A4JFV4_BURVG|nr:hypothetical protein Bcep1808_2155 [Burkholderia vietnamiensis G4]